MMKLLAPLYPKLVTAALFAAASACDAETGQPGAAPSEQSRTQLRQVPDCEGCEAAWERDAANLTAKITLAPPGEPGEPLLLRGIVYRPDGRTPASGVVLYVYHTNSAGLYANGSDESEWSLRHGRLRGWLKTGSDGRYEVRTIKPGKYPDRTDPAHVHFTVLEEGKDPYWIDDVVFDGEPGVDAAYRAERQDRGGSGIVRLQRDSGGTWLAKRNIVLKP